MSVKERSVIERIALMVCIGGALWWYLWRKIEYYTPIDIGAAMIVIVGLMWIFRGRKKSNDIRQGEGD